MAKFAYDHIHLRSPNAEETAQWYERIFGAEVIRSIQSDGRPRIDLNLGGVAVFIAQVPQEQEVGEPPHPPISASNTSGFGSRASTRSSPT